MQDTALTPRRPSSNGRRDLLTFRMGQRVCAIPIEPIAQVIEMVTIVPLPEINGLIEGIINVRGDFIPVLSLHTHFGLTKPAWQLHTPIILIALHSQMLGLIVDEVLDVETISSERVIAPETILPDKVGTPAILQGIAHNNQQTLFILNTQRLFDPIQAKWEVLSQAISTEEGGVAA